MADNTTVFIDYNSGTPVLVKECDVAGHDHTAGDQIGKDDQTTLYKDDTVTLEMRNFPSTCNIVELRFYNNEDEAPAHKVGSFTPTTTTTSTTIQSDKTVNGATTKVNDYMCEVKQVNGAWDFTKAYIQDIEDVAADTEDDFWYQVDINWTVTVNGKAEVKTKTLDPELINKPGRKGGPVGGGAAGAHG